LNIEQISLGNSIKSKFKENLGSILVLLENAQGVRFYGGDFLKF
jgi:hypothetical protein